MVKYFHNTADHNLNAPGIIIPDIINWFQPQSLLDVGCGIGTFLRVAIDNGIIDCMGLDGDWVNRDLLYVDESIFQTADLTRTFNLGRIYDIAICLEVAEHLPESSADGLVASLCKHANIIVFSAAIPGQGGQHHINEQPYNYWREKFAAQGFEWYDVFRKRYWEEERIEWWYKQNMFLVAKAGTKLPADFSVSDNDTQLWIHPEMWQQQLILYPKKLEDAQSRERAFFEGRYTYATYWGILWNKTIQILRRKLGGRVTP